MKASRRNLNSAEIETVLKDLGCEWVRLDVRDQVESTNDDVLAYRAEIQPGRAFAVTAEEQFSGRGRLDRAWSSPWGAGIALSVACSTADVSGQISSVPLRVGLAIVKALENLGIATAVKWPNDVVTTDDPMRKLGGVLVQLHDDILVIGIGVNVSLQADELPTESATSLFLLGHQDVSRESLIAHILDALNIELAHAGWLDSYRSTSRTLGQSVRITRLNQDEVIGVASDISDSGALLVTTNQGVTEVSMGDVEHLRSSN